MRNSGLRPNVELNQLKWCHIKRENVGTWSESEQQQVVMWIAVIYIRDSKTGRQRIVPTNGVDSHLLQWKKEQQDYINQYRKDTKITDQYILATAASFSPCSLKLPLSIADAIFSQTIALS